MSDQHDPLEDQLRAALRSGSGRDPDVDGFLGAVHRGARRRRTRRTLAGAAAAVCLVAGGGYVVAASGVLDEDRAPVADQSISTTPGTDGTGSPLASSGNASTEAAPPAGIDPADIVPVDVAAGDADQQWVLGSVPGGECGERRCPRVLATQDAGASWSDLGELPAHLVRGTEDPRSVDGLTFTLDGQDGWAYRGALLSTHDGGQSWAPAELPVRANVVQVETAGDHVLALTYNGETSTLLRSPVDGDDWEEVPLEQQLGEDVDLLSVQEIASGSGLVTVTVSHAPSYQGRLMISVDEGATWDLPPNTRYCEQGRSAGPISIAEEALWVGCRVNDGPYSITPVVSTDVGETWSPQGGTYGGGGKLAARNADSAIVMEWVDQDLGTGGARLYDTSVPPDEQPDGIATVGSGTPLDLFFTDPETGFLHDERDGFFRTTDGGRTWEAYGVTNLD